MITKVFWSWQHGELAYMKESCFGLFSGHWATMSLKSPWCLHMSGTFTVEKSFWQETGMDRAFQCTPYFIIAWKLFLHLLPRHLCYLETLCRYVQTNLQCFAKEIMRVNGKLSKDNVWMTSNVFRPGLAFQWGWPLVVEREVVLQEKFCSFLVSERAVKPQGTCASCSILECLVSYWCMYFHGLVLIMSRAVSLVWKVAWTSFLILSKHQFLCNVFVKLL